MPSLSHSPVAVIAGGTAGVGRATLDALIDRGWNVAVLARGQDRLDSVKEAFGDRVWTRSVDVSDAAAVEAAADDILSDFGVPEIWINAAMLTSFSPFDKVDAEEFGKITATTYLGTVNGCRAALRVMARGNIVNVGSGLAYTSVPNQAAYCGAKHAIEGFTQALRIELLRDKRPLTLSMVQLPAVNTPQFEWARNRMDHHAQPAPPIYQPEVAARAVLRAIDTNAREILVGRSVLKLMAGNMLFPNTVEAQLTEMGVEAQQDDRPAPHDRDNLDGPAPYPSTAHGTFDGRAEDDGIIVDGDFARKFALFGGAAAMLFAGMVLGRAIQAGAEATGDRIARR
ncbi:SDR family oxidoreductase [Jannaschia sp. 2305UL9-9]|uniref:SDR family oxidoreductase n=1 Tax=Jannaschia sp. 2305UL9-9 TaxID=3121638 RepID=UPI0035281430